MGKIKYFLILLVASMVLSVSAVAAAPEVSAESAILMDAETGQVLYDKEMHKKMYPASITKIMTTILAVENLSLDDTIVMSADAVNAVSRDASHIALTEGEKITVREAVYAALLASANDACNGIAEKVSGSMDAFARLMTQKAKEMGAKGTNFTNSNGLKDENHYTTAYDMAHITAYGLKNETWREMFGCRRYEMPPTNKQEEIRYLNNQHKMIFEKKDYYEGIVGGKTGYTTVAKNTLVTAAQRDGIELIVVVMKCPQNADTYTDTKALLDYGFENYKKITVSQSDLEANTVEGYELALGDVTSILVPIDAKDVVKKVETKGDEASIVILSGEEELGRIPLNVVSAPVVSKELVEDKKDSGGPTFLGVVFTIILVVVGLFVLLIVVLYIRKEIYLHRRRRARREQRRNRR